jgi:chromate transporter
MKNLIEVTLLFLKLGLTGFGGPAAHIAMLHDEVVKRRQWLTDEQFLDLLGATNLIPGPNSTEMCIHIGYIRAGWPGLIAAGLAFVLPATLIVMGFGWLYTRYGTLPQTEWLLYGIKPVIIAIIVRALWDLGRKALKGWLLPIGLAVAAGYFFGVNELLLLFVGGMLVFLARNGFKRPKIGTIPNLLPLGFFLPAAAVPFNLPLLFLTFLKIGSVLYGSGYVLLAFLRADFVLRLGWLTDQQLIDAVTIGQVTPGPLFTAATFIGYVLGGPFAAILATLGIFLPSFVLVALSNPLIPRLRQSPLASALLDGVNAASAGLMAAVTIQLGRASLIDPLSIVVALVSFLLLWRTKINATWLVLAGGVLGLLVHWM